MRVNMYDYMSVCACICRYAPRGVCVCVYTLHLRGDTNSDKMAQRLLSILLGTTANTTGDPKWLW